MTKIDNTIETGNEKKSFRQWQIREGNVLYRLGVEQLSNTDLLAHLLRNRTLAERLMGRFNSLFDIADASITELQQVFGVGPATAEILHAAFELSYRIDSVYEERPHIRDPHDVYMLVRNEYQGQPQEISKVILLNTINRVLKIETVFIGTVNYSVMNPREIFRVAVRQNAASIILTHNHPSGSPKPSAQDIKVTHQIAEIGKLIDIPLIDHVIVGDGSYVSLKERELLDSENELLEIF